MSVRTMETQDHMRGVIEDLQLRKLELGAKIVALQAEIKRLKDANADQQIVIQIKDREMDKQAAEFIQMSLWCHVRVWLRGRW